MSDDQLTTFKFETRPDVSFAAADVGGFDVQYKLRDDFTTDQEECLGEWLSLNCSANFVFIKDIHRRLAGGTTNNKLSWQRRTTPLSKSFSVHHTYIIRLHTQDKLLFELVWMSDFKSVNY